MIPGGCPPRLDGIISHALRTLADIEDAQTIAGVLRAVADAWASG